MKKLYHLFLTFALLSAAGCNDFLDPDDDNSYKGDELLTYIQRAEGVLLNAYASVPNANQISVMTDVATDNAVWNTSSGNAFRNIVSGEWRLHEQSVRQVVVGLHGHRLLQPVFR